MNNNRTRALSGLAGLVFTAALVLGTSTPALAIGTTYTGYLSCGNNYPVVIVNAKSGTVDMNYGRSGDEFQIAKKTTDQRFTSARHAITWTVTSKTLTKVPRVICAHPGAS